MKKTNENLRKHAKTNNVRLWQIAEELGIDDSAFSRKLRHELPDDQKAEILDIIERLKED